MSTQPKHHLTAEEFAALPLGDLRSELIEGELVSMPPTFEDHSDYTINLSISSCSMCDPATLAKCTQRGRDF